VGDVSSAAPSAHEPPRDHSPRAAPAPPAARACNPPGRPPGGAALRGWHGGQRGHLHAGLLDGGGGSGSCWAAQGAPAADCEQRAPLLTAPADRLEDALFTLAPSKEAYADPGTLNDRLQQVARRLVSQKAAPSPVINSAAAHGGPDGLQQQQHQQHQQPGPSGMPDLQQQHQQLGGMTMVPNMPGMMPGMGAGMQPDPSMPFGSTAPDIKPEPGMMAFGGAGGIKQEQHFPAGGGMMPLDATGAPAPGMSAFAAPVAQQQPQASPPQQAPGGLMPNPGGFGASNPAAALMSNGAPVLREKGWTSSPSLVPVSSWLRPAVPCITC